MILVSDFGGVRRQKPVRGGEEIEAPRVDRSFENWL